jgi:hemoglobin
MEKMQLDSREAIELLVNDFYSKVKMDPLLGDIFNNAENFSWEKHIPIMVTFWEMLLLGTTGYRGNTVGKHIELNKRSPIGEEHFDRWKKLFFETLDTLFEGPNVAVARKKAEAMSILMLFKLEQSTKKGFIQ